MKAVILFLGLISTSALAAEWMEYPVHVKLQSHEACLIVASNIDKQPGQPEADFSLRCKGEILEGHINAGPLLSSVAFKITVHDGDKYSCDQLMKNFQGPKVSSSCETFPGKTMWIAQLNYPLSGGVEMSKIQEEKADHLEAEKNRLEKLKDRQVCEESAKSSSWFDQFMRWARGNPCKWMQPESNPAITNETGATKGSRPTGDVDTTSDSHARSAGE
jgi:hypothetical protein